jgi:hypothetical protein
MTNREAIGDDANPCDQVAELVMRLDKLGYRGDYSIEVFNKVIAATINLGRFVREGEAK